MDFETLRSTSLLLLAPSQKPINRTNDQLAAASVLYSNTSPRLMLQQALVPRSSLGSHLVLETSELEDQPVDLDPTKFLTSMAYVHFSDPNLPGPAYDIPHDIFVRAAPRESKPRRVWESMYERFRDKRMNVCGLDLEPMPRENREPLTALDTDRHEGV